MENTKNLLLLFFAANICFSSSAKHLPHYIKACRGDDPEFSKCAVDHANAAIPYLVKGDPEYNFEPLNPMKIPEVVIDNKQGFKLKMTNVSVYGFDTAKVKEMNANYTTLKSNQIYTLEKLSLMGNYEIDGKILSQDISGNGKANLTLIKPTFYLIWNMGTKIKDGVKYLTLVKSEATYDLEGMIYKIDNLFNGNKKRSDDMNKFLNENWRALHDQFGSIFARILLKVIRDDALSIMESVPMDEVFPK